MKSRHAPVDWEVDLCVFPLSAERIIAVSSRGTILVEQYPHEWEMADAVERLVAAFDGRPRAIVARGEALAALVREVHPPFAHLVQAADALPRIDRLESKELQLPLDDARERPLEEDAPRWIAAMYRLHVAATRAGASAEQGFHFRALPLVFNPVRAVYEPGRGLLVLPHHAEARRLAARDRLGTALRFTVYQQDEPAPAGLALPNGKTLVVSMHLDKGPVPPTIEATRNLLAITQAVGAWYEHGGPTDVETVAGTMMAVGLNFVAHRHERELAAGPDGALRLAYTLARPMAERVAERAAHLDGVTLRVVEGGAVRVMLLVGQSLRCMEDIPAEPAVRDAARACTELQVEVRAPDATLASVRLPVR